MKKGGKPHAPAPLWVVLALVTLAGCQDIFTYTPLKGFQRDPSSLSSEQRLEYAQNALASGDKSTMRDAYDAIKTDTSPDAVHLTAELGIELSGVPGLINDAVTDESAVTGSGTTIADYINSHEGLDPLLIIDAGQSMVVLAGTGYLLSTNDRILGAIGLALGDSSPSYVLTPGNQQDAVDLLAPLVASGDTFAKSLSDFLANPPP